MDCSTARVYLQLGGHEAEELQQHLAHCNVCHQQAMEVNRLDQHLGRAMRAVEVPRALKDQLLQRLDADRGGQHRRVAGRALRYGAAAAALLLLGWGVFAYYGSPRPVIVADDVLHGGNLTRASDEDKVNDQLKLLGSVAGAPSFVDYRFLKGSPSLAVLPGTEGRPVKVPQLIFTDGRREATVYCVPAHKYRIEELSNPAQGYKYDLEVYTPPDEGSFAYFILHTGGDWRNWLEVKEK